MKNLFTLVVAVALCSSIGFAQGLGLKGVGGSVGYMTASITTGGLNSTSESLGGFAIGAHVDLGEFTPGFQLIPELQYWTASKDLNGVNVKFSDFAINGNVHYNIAMEGSVKPFVGAGVGLNFVSSTVDVPGYTVLGVTYGGGSVSASDTKFGVNLMGGVNIGMGNMTISPEVRYVLISDVNHLLLKVGVTVPLGK